MIRKIQQSEEIESMLKKYCSAFREETDSTSFEEDLQIMETCASIVAYEVQIPYTPVVIKETIAKLADLTRTHRFYANFVRVVILEPECPIMKLHEPLLIDSIYRNDLTQDINIYRCTSEDEFLHLLFCLGRKNLGKVRFVKGLLAGSRFVGEILCINDEQTTVMVRPSEIIGCTINVNNDCIELIENDCKK